MSTRINNTITLNHTDAARIAFLLNDYAGKQALHARNTKSENIKSACSQTATECRAFADRIFKQLWTWSDDIPAKEGKQLISEAISHFGHLCVRLGSAQNAGADTMSWGLEEELKAAREQLESLIRAAPLPIETSDNV